ncbi:substrate-binding periplasmic protein [Kordiimonas marina]|uniref:substrate-binding periplasmic protein n=1 Tax=Kordiimonas marina TaxID=2872312 RepID=UPI001FF4EEE3|nr:transporter substrate-binding domain-containing protein [Kordiimonas marina]MCJ9428039.1 transporter substrate-binding domain-containing protein [Kordiimonas marina]
MSVPVRSLFLGLLLCFSVSLPSVAQASLKVGQSNSIEYSRVWEAILNDAGIRADFVIAPTDKKRQMFVNGAIQLDCCASPLWRQKPEEKAVQLFSDVFYRSPEYYVFPEGHVLKIKAAQDLRQFRVAVIRGFSYKGEEDFGSVVECRDMNELLDTVAAGKADLAFINLNDYQRRMREKPRAVALGQLAFIADLRIQVRRSSAKLLPRINGAIARLKASGRIEAILNDLDADNLRVRVGQSDSSGFHAVWSAILHAADIEPEFIDAPQERKRRLFTEGVILLDCCAAPLWRTRPDEVATQLWSDTFYVTREQFVFVRGKEPDVSTPAALRKLRVAVVRGFDYKDQAFFGLKVPGRDVEDVLTLLAAGRADVGIISNVDFHALMRRHPGPFVLGPVRVEAEQKIRVNKAAASLLPRINAAIRRMKAEGRIKALLEGPSAGKAPYSAR